MRTYYRFSFPATQEILEFDAEKVSLATAKRKALVWAKESNSTCEYLGIFHHGGF